MLVSIISVTFTSCGYVVARELCACECFMRSAAFCLLRIIRRGAIFIGRSFLWPAALSRTDGSALFLLVFLRIIRPEWPLMSNWIFHVQLVPWQLHLPVTNYKLTGLEFLVWIFSFSDSLFYKWSYIFYNQLIFSETYVFTLLIKKVKFELLAMENS